VGLPGRGGGEAPSGSKEAGMTDTRSRAASLALIVCTSVALLAGCHRPQGQPVAPEGLSVGRAAPAATDESTAPDSQVVRVEPEVELTQPETRATVTTSESGAEVVAELAEAGGRKHTASMRRDEDVSAETLGIELPAGAKRLAGADLTKLESGSALYEGLAGSKGVVYEVPQPAAKVLDFYREHQSGRYQVFDSAGMKDIGLASVGADTAVVMVLDDPSHAIAVQNAGDKLTRLLIVDMSGSKLGAGDTEEGPH